MVKKASKPAVRPGRATAARGQKVRTSSAGDLLLIGGALGLSAHVLSREPAQLAGQLNGRLNRSESSAVARLVKRAVPTSGRVWLRPGTNSLLSPGGPGVRRFEPKSGFKKIREMGGNVNVPMVLGLVSEMSQKYSPWIICDRCVDLFDADRAAARRRATKYWSSGEAPTGAVGDRDAAMAAALTAFTKMEDGGFPLEWPTR